MGPVRLDVAAGLGGGGVGVRGRVVVVGAREGGWVDPKGPASTRRRVLHPGHRGGAGSRQQASRMCVSQFTPRLAALGRREMRPRGGPRPATWFGPGGPNQQGRSSTDRRSLSIIPPSEGTRHSSARHAGRRRHACVACAGRHSKAERRIRNW